VALLSDFIQVDLQQFSDLPSAFCKSSSQILALLYNISHKFILQDCCFLKAFKTGCKKKAEKQSWGRGRRRRMEGGEGGGKYETVLSAQGVSYGVLSL